MFEKGGGDDIITDFQDGIDKILLKGDLTFDDLTFTVNEFGAVKGSYEGGSILFKNITDKSKITADDFISNRVANIADVAQDGSDIAITSSDWDIFG
ncbi:hypothetical protein [Hoeflea sp.]|uniref:hypothetical protein n=1 Tax=Hoeflea sp. TaxID=1940281 RepID=UPI003B015C0A